jgi:tetratricopeptide (TPR) repeat protein
MSKHLRRSPAVSPSGEARGPSSLASRSRRSFAGLLLLLATVTVIVSAVHWPVLTAQALTLDDESYVTNNHLVRHPGWGSVAQFFGEVRRPSTVGGYYQPLTMTSLMLDWALGARVEDLRGFHRTGLILHVLNTILVILVLYHLFGRALPAALIGLLFGVHPMTVEPLAWITERKTLLAAFFSLAAMLAYLAYVRRPTYRRYGSLLALFVLALLSKPTSTPLPVLLLLLDVWPLRRLDRRAVLEKVPLFAIAGVSAVITVISQAETASVTLPHEYTGWWVPLTVCHNLIFYPWKMVWPAELTSFNAYPQPFDLSNPRVLTGVLGTTVLIPALAVSWRWTRALLTGWLFFFVAVFPTLGVIGFTHLIAADKYVYLPVLGLLLTLTWLLVHVSEWTSASGRRAGRAAFVVLLLLSGAAAYGTRRQLAYWQTTEALYVHMLAITPNAPMLHDDFGNELTRLGRLDEAITQFETAIQLDPTLFKPHNNIGVALLRQGRNAAAIPQLEEAIRLNPEYAAAENSLGTALAQLKEYEAAFPHFQRALALSPYMPDIHVNVANILATRHQWQEAADEYEKALQLRPDLVFAHNGLGLCFVQLKQPDRAAAAFRAAIRAQPDELEGYRNLGRLLLSQQQIAEAIEVYETALHIAPDDKSLQAALNAALAKRAAPAP